MVLSLSISPEAEARLKAKAAGVDVETYASRQLEQIAAPSPSLPALSGPIAAAVEQSGMGEDELADLLECEKHAWRRERREKRVG